MTEPLVRKYDRPVPRYTSYPTAAQFTGAVGVTAYRAWLAALPARTAVSLYVHLPFCRQLCWFCGCHTTVLNRTERLAAYLGLLEREAEAVAGALEAPQLAAMYWGGGTPTILAADEMLHLADVLHKHFAPALGAEFSVEVDPRAFTRERAQALARAGLTRASLGVQDLDPEVQRAIHREQTLDQTLCAAEWLREAGASSLNVDLMYGLPKQTEAGVARTAQAVADRLRPERIAVFGYAHVPWMKRHQKLLEASGLPDAAARFRQAQTIAAVLCDRGYRRIGLDHFARAGDPLARVAAEGRLRRNFQGYTDDDAGTLIGLGASAIGILPQGYAQNAAALPAYGQAVRSSGLATVRGVALSDEDRLRRAVIERLMCDLKADLGALAREHGRPATWFDRELAALAPLVRDGLVEIEGPRLRVTEAGRPFVRVAAAAFDAYLDRWASAQRHARAI